MGVRPSVAHNAPNSSYDYDFFYNGLEETRLLVQRCDSCGILRNPPGPMCPHCNSLEWKAEDMPAAGTVYSYVVHHYPKLPNFESPHIVIVAAFENGVRFVGALFNIAPNDVTIGMPVDVRFKRYGDLASFHFVPTGSLPQ